MVHKLETLSNSDEGGPEKMRDCLMQTQGAITRGQTTETVSLSPVSIDTNAENQCNVGTPSIRCVKDPAATIREDNEEPECNTAQVSPSRLSPYLKFLGQCNDHWVLEMMGCAMAVGCLVAIVAILAVYQDQPLPDSPDAISINSWVSVFTAIMKTAIMLPVAEGISQLKWLFFRQERPLIQMEVFSSASRGPWGAALLLLSSFRGHHLASFGAFISILAMAIDPFSQQIIQYYMCFPISRDAVAVTPRTNNYTADGIPTRQGNAELNVHVSNAITLGTLDQAIQESDLITFVCPSGNCTFPADSNGAAFQTLGMCHTCSEINHLIHANTTYDGYWLENWKLDPAWGDWWNRGAWIGYTFPNSSHNTPYSMFWSRKTLALNPEFDDLITVDALMLNIDADCRVEDSVSCPKHPWAVRCSVYPCIKTYSTNIVNSKLTETVLSTTSLRKTNMSAAEITTSPGLTFSLATDRILRNGTWTQCKISDAPSTETPFAVGTNNTLIFHNPYPGSPLRYYEPECVWNFGYEIGLGLNQYMSWMYDDNDYDYLEAFVESTMETQGPQALKMLYRNGTATLDSVNSHFSGLTGAITAMMRQRGEGGTAEWVYGNVLESKTCIRVQWPWLTLPVALVLLSIAFLILTAVCSIRAGMWTGAWRSSSVAPIIAGINSNNHSTVRGGVGRLSQVEDIASKVYVQIVNKEERLEITRLPHSFEQKSSATLSNP